MKRPCRFFNSSKGCPKDDCPYLHEKTKNRRCRFFSSPQGCPYGMDCAFTHEAILLEKYKQAINKVSDEQSSKKQKTNNPVCFCPVCKLTFEKWDDTKKHFEESGHIGAHCCQCGKSFVVIHHRNLHEKETGHDVYKGVLVQETFLKEIPDEYPKVTYPPSNDPPHILVDHFYHGLKISFDKKSFNEDYAINSLIWLVSNNVYKGVVKIIGLGILLFLEDLKLSLRRNDDVGKLIQSLLEQNQDLQLIYQLYHVYGMEINLKSTDLVKFKHERVEQKIFDGSLDNKLTEFKGLKDPKVFERYLLDAAEKAKPTLSDHERIKTVFEKVSSLVKSLWKESETHLFGSTRMGFFDAQSDVDINVSVPDKYLLTEKHALMQLEVLFNQNKYEQVYVVYTSRVPLVSFVIDGIHVDVVIGKELNIKKTELIMNYVQCDERVYPLLFALKRWKKSIANKFITNECNLTNRGDLNLSTNQSRELTFFCLCLMLIYYLQTLKVPVLPTIEKLASWKSDNTDLISTLLVGFFQEFAFFDYNNIISIRLAGPLSRDQSDIKNYGVCVEDPFEIDINCARQISKRKLTVEMKRALIHLFETGCIW